MLVRIGPPREDAECPEEEVDEETIAPENLAMAAAQGVAIALAAREASVDLASAGHIVAGRFPRDLFEVMLERDTASGVVKVKSIQPYQPAE